MIRFPNGIANKHYGFSMVSFRFAISGFRFQPSTVIWSLGLLPSWLSPPCASSCSFWQLKPRQEIHLNLGALFLFSWMPRDKGKPPNGSIPFQTKRGKKTHTQQMSAGWWFPMVSFRGAIWAWVKIQIVPTVNIPIQPLKEVNSPANQNGIPKRF